MLEKIIAAFDQDSSDLSKQSMLIAAESLKQRLVIKGQVFNCIVLENAIIPTYYYQQQKSLSYEGYDSPRSEDPLATESKQALNAQDALKDQGNLKQWFKENENSELAILLTLLKINIDNIADNTKIQVIIRSENHWFNLDISIIKRQLNFFLIDAADFTVYISPVIATINLIYPNAIINVFKSNLQRDSENCGYFALDIAVSLSKLANLYHELPRTQSQLFSENSNESTNFLGKIEEKLISPNITQDKVQKIINQINFIPGRALPKACGSLLKNMQPLNSVYTGIYRFQGYLRHNQKPLDDYIINHLKKSSTSNNMISRAIKIKKQKIKKNALYFIRHNPVLCIKIVKENDSINRFVKNLTNNSGLATVYRTKQSGFFKPLTSDNMEKANKNGDDASANLTLK